MEKESSSETIQIKPLLSYLLTHRLKGDLDTAMQILRERELSVDEETRERLAMVFEREMRKARKEMNKENFEVYPLLHIDYRTGIRRGVFIIGEVKGEGYEYTTLVDCRSVERSDYDEIVTEDPFYI